MAKQLNVSLAFTANTQEAKAQLQDLQRQLNNILKTPSSKLGVTNEIREAISATAELSSRLQQATNINTGNLDFSKFNNSLKQSGQSLSSYGQQLQKLGPTGQQAFLTLTKSIAAAEVPIKRTNALVKEFTTTLANTARWQISSSVLHGLMGSMQSAYRYAQDLNESLTDIRIVTGQSADQMAKFAKQANIAAKQLSATTLEYTNASLIYYQQGLTDQQVKDRTDVTVKMANVTKQSAETVSEQMTAVWNNFYNGSKSLEYYADVMTALGAATASSADEIAGGLEKFAAIGETIGLSYEYAASALATITSNTRQSEEVVGTALKTIFARIQGLNLGETLDDGVTLNKYSAALQAVGISIFDSAGELKKMDNILNEMGDKWTSLSKAQQTALAQTVAGTRQYTQLIALMQNWNNGDSDSMKANLDTAYGSTGSLQDQADIYAESWEAARDRVSAAAEKIYNALLNDDFFIDILNGFEKVLTFVDQLIDNLGGLKGVFLALGAIITKVFSAQLSQGLSSMAYNIKMAFPSGRKAVEKERRDFIENAANSIPQSNEYTTDVEKAQQDSLRTELTLQMEYMDNAEKMSAIEADTNKKLIERTRILKEHTVELNKRKSSIDDNISNKTMSLRGAIQLENEANPGGNQINYEKQVKPLTDQIKTISSIQAILQDTTNVVSAIERAGEQGSKTMQLFKADLMSINTDNMSAEIKTLINEINQMGDSPDPVLLKEKIEALNFELEKLSQRSVKKIKTFVPKETRDDVDNLTQSFKDQAVVQRELNQTNRDSAEAYKAAADGIRGATGSQKQWSDVMVESANVAFNVATAISMVGSAIDTLKDPDVSGMQKLVTVLSTMGMVLPTIISLIGTMKKLFSSETVAKIANAAATWAQVAAEKSLNKTKGEGSEVTKKNIKETWQDTVWKSTKKENQDKYIEQVLKDKGYIRDKKTGGWGKTTLGKNGAKRFDPSTVISNDDAVKMATPDAQKMAGKGAFKALGSKIASAGIAAAGIAVIIGTVAMVVDQLNKAEKAVEKAKAAAQALSENYDNVKASYDEFINAQSGYETAVKSMEELTKGTIEYQEALLDANAAAGDLLAKHKNLKYEVVNGKIEIDKDSLEQIQQDELKKVEAAQAAKIAGQRQVSAAEMELKKRDAARDMKSGSDGWVKAGNSTAAGILGAVGAGLAAGGTAGLIAGSATGPAALITGAIGASIGLITGVVTGIVQETSTDTEQQAIDALAKKANQDADFLARLKAGEVGKEEFEKIGIKDEGLIASLQQNGEKISELVGEMAANTAAMEAQNDLVASNVLSDNETVQNSQFKDQIIDLAGDAYGRAYDKAMESDWVDEWGKDGISKATGVNKEAKKVFEEYLKYAGLEGQGYTLTDTTGTDKDRKFIYKDADGGTKEVSLEAMQAARAAYEASETLDQCAEELAATFEELANSADLADKGLLSFIGKQDLEDITQADYKAMANEIDNVGVGWFLDNRIGDGTDGIISDKTAQKYGFDTREEMEEALNQAVENMKIAWDSITIKGVKSFDQLSYNSAQALDNAFKNIRLGPKGREMGQEFVNGINKMLDKIDPSKQQAALEKLATIDWSSWDAMDQAVSIMNEFGVNIDTTTGYWEQFTEKMRVAARATPDYTKLKNDLIEISSIIKDLTFGSEIKEEDYQAVIKYKSAWKDFFVLQSDGTRKFIGNQTELLAFTRESMATNQKNLTLQKQYSQSLLDKNLNVDFGAQRVEYYGGGDGLDGKFDFGEGQKAREVLESQGFVFEENGTIRHGGKVVSNDEASAFAMNALKGNLVQDTLYSNPEFFNLLETKGYDRKSIDTAIALAKGGDTEKLDALLEVFNTLLNQEDYDDLISDQSEMLASTSTSYLDFTKLLTSTSGETKISEETQQKTLLSLASAYNDCSDEVLKYKKALASGDSKKIEEAQKELVQSLKASEWRKTTREVKQYYTEIKKLTEAEDIAEKQQEIADSLNNLFGTNITSAFVRENWSLFEEWANATGKRATELALEIETKAVMAGLKASEILETIKNDVDADNDGEFDQLTQKWLDLKNIIENNRITINLDGKADLTDLISKLHETGYSAKEIANLLASLGHTEIEIEGEGLDLTEIDFTSAEGIADFINLLSNWSNEISVVSAVVPDAGVADMTTINDSGGGGSKPKKTEKTRKSDVVDRYKEINDQLDDVKDRIEDANRAADGLWGPARLKKMREVQKEMGKELQMLREKKKQAKAYLDEDKAELQKVAAENNAMEFKFDDNHNITNYTEVMTALYNELKAAQDAAGPTTDENEQEKIDAIQERIDAVKEALGLYDTTKEELEDIDNEIADYIRGMQEQYLEQLNLQLEIEITVDDSQLAEIEYYLSKSNEDIWSMAESLALMSGQGKEIFNFDEGQADIWFGKFADYQKSYEDLVWSYTHINPETGETYINQQQFIDKLVELQGEIYGNLQNINELDKSVISYYGEVLSSASEELSKYTDLLDHHVGVLDHYSSLLEIMGKSKDYERMKLLTQTTLEITKNSAEISKANYTLLANEAEQKKKAWDALGKGLSDELTYEESVIKQQWLDAQAAANEAQNTMLEDAQSWAESLKAVLEITLEELGDNLEKALSAEFGSLDFMMTSMEHAQSLQEEFLTTTNKIYETDKMIRNAQKEIDKTTNQMAKNKLKQFINETTILQEQGQLSQFELDIQQAKYDLLLAEIALKEAQNAKSTVRLQRDSEGNFGYVYTADQGAIDDAQQKFADAQNNLYNISLDGANKYTEQYIQTMQEMNDAIAEVWANEELSLEEKNRRQMELEAYYYDKLSQFSYLYSVAVSTDSRVIDEAWSKDFSHMTTQTETWMKNVSDYGNQAALAFQTYQTAIDEVEKWAGLDLDSLKEKTKGIKDESNGLTKAITDPNNGLISALDKELNTIMKLTEGYVAWRKEIQGAVTDQEDLAKLIGQDIKNESDDDESNDKKPEVTEQSKTEEPKTEEPKVEEPKEPTLAVGDTVTIKAGSHTFTNGTSMADFLETGSAQRQVMQINGDNVLIGWGGTATGWVHKSVLQGFNTGGYTGEWGPYGKMAMLHEKELVLNAGDTENFLASLEFLHKILEIIDLQTMSSQLGGILTSPGMYNNNMNTVEQNVHIEASFPNAVNHSEIEEAFNNLINTSSQFANKK